MSYFQNAKRHIVGCDLINKGTFQKEHLGKIYYQTAISYYDGDQKKYNITLVLHEDASIFEKNYDFSSCHDGIVFLKKKLS